MDGDRSHLQLIGDEKGDSEKSKVLQSIASVIQAMPPIDETPVIEARFDPPF